MTSRSITQGWIETFAPLARDSASAACQPANLEANGNPQAMIPSGRAVL